MNATRTVCLLFITLSFAASTASAADMGTGFTYQGKLENPPGTAVDDTCDFRVGLWDAATLGNQIGTSPQTKLAVAVENGIFTLGPPATTALDFGADSINGQARWLDIEVKCTGDAGFVPLAPRVEMTPAPHALALPGLHTRQHAISPNIIGGFAGNTVGLTAAGATIAGGGMPDNGIGSSDNNRITASYGMIGGGIGNSVTEIYGVVAGGSYNSAWATCSVGGGSENTATQAGSTVAGGWRNRATGQWASIGGGSDNVASGGFGATVAGGSDNEATASYASVPGGALNKAGGESSFASGYRAVVRDFLASGDPAGDRGTFIWSDTSSDSDFTSTARDQFLIRAENGVGIHTNDPQARLHVAGDAIIEGAATIGASATINNHAYFLNSVGGPKVAIGAANYQADEALSIFGQDALAISGFQPFITFYDTNAANARTRIANAGGTFSFFPESFIGGNAPLVITNTTGRVGIGDTTPEVTLDVVGDINYTGVIVDVSDERLKSNIQPLECALDKVAHLRGISFTLKGASDQREVGLIAQDVQQVLPEAVRIVDNEHGYLGVSYPSVVSLLVEAVKEQDNAIAAKNCEIESLGSEISNLKSEIDELKSLVKALADRHNNGEGQ